MADTAPIKKCPVCFGKGYLRCDCWPGDCICAYGDEYCEDCGGTGDADFHGDDDGYPPGYWDTASVLSGKEE